MGLGVDTLVLQSWGVRAGRGGGEDREGWGRGQGGSLR